MFAAVSNRNENVIVLGASPNPIRYAYKACRMLLEAKHNIFPIGNKEGIIYGNKILKEFPADMIIDTITVYINPSIQENYKDVILTTAPKRIIFNPGTENSKLYQQFSNQGIQCIEACTLVMLRTNQY